MVSYVSKIFNQVLLKYSSNNLQSIVTEHETRTMSFNERSTKEEDDINVRTSWCLEK